MESSFFDQTPKTHSIEGLGEVHEDEKCLQKITVSVFRDHLNCLLEVLQAGLVGNEPVLLFNN